MMLKNFFVSVAFSFIMLHSFQAQGNPFSETNEMVDSMEDPGEEPFSKPNDNSESMEDPGEEPFGKPYGNSESMEDPGEEPFSETNDNSDSMEDPGEEPFGKDSVEGADTQGHSSDTDDMIAIMEDIAATGYTKDGDHITIPKKFIDILLGRYGHYGSHGGVVYTRWGKTSCPSTYGTKMLYTGYAGGSWYAHHGGGANYLCLPKQPQYLKNGIPPNNLLSFLYGAEYQNTFVGVHDHNVPCTVCYVSNRAAKLMIPAQLQCPQSWTKEYQGYLMAERFNHARNTVYECVDENAETLPGTAANTDGALFYHVVSKCARGLPCPPYVTTKTLTCVVCTK